MLCLLYSFIKKFPNKEESPCLQMSKPKFNEESELSKVTQLAVV